MKKRVIMFQKNGGLLRPAHLPEFDKIQDEVIEGAWCQAEFSDPKKPKSNDQLGYLYAGIYPHMIAHYKQTQGYIFQIHKGSELIDVEPNTVSVDLYLKTLFCIHKSIPEFKKEKASLEDLMEYINFLDKHSIDRFDCHLPPSKIKQEK